MRPSNACALVLLLLCGVLPWQSRAQTADLPYCYTSTNQCYATLGEAEAALRASVVEGDRMKDTGISTVAASGAVTKTYAAESPIMASTMFDKGYVSGPDALGYPPRMPPEYACARTGSPYSGGACKDMQELLEESVKRNTPAACVAEPPVLTGGLPEPYGGLLKPAIEPDGSQPWSLSSGSIEWYFHYVCDGKRYRSPSQLSYKHTLIRYQDFYCPAGYLATSNKSVWPKLCVSSTKRYIRVLSKKVCDDCQSVNDHPIFPSTGNKARFEADFIFAGRSFVRNYHSVMQFDDPSLAPGWTTSFGMRLYKATDDGRRIHYASSSGFVDRFNTLDGVTEVTSYFASGRRLRRVPVNGVDTYEVVEKSGEVLYFDKDGILQAIAHPATPERDLTFLYAAGKVSAVVDTQGRRLQFEYLEGRLSRVILPDGGSIGYGYDGDRNLVVVDYGNGQVKRYHYSRNDPLMGAGGSSGGGSGQSFAITNFPSLLTGITSEDGQRYATFKYDALDRPVYSGLHGAEGGVHETRVEYLPGTPKTVRVTRETGEAALHTYTANQKPLLTKIQSETEPGRVQLFEYSGYQISKATDAKGVVTTYAYPGNTTSVTRATGTLAQQKVETDRSVVTNLPLERRQYDAAGALIAKSTTTYNGRAQATAVTRTDAVSGQSRVSSLVYCEEADVTAGLCPIVGLLMAVDGPRTDVPDATSYAYYAQDHADCAASPSTCAYRKGDLWRVTDALGHVTETLKYDGAGRALSIKDANGVVTDLEYHARGWLTARKVRGTDAASEADDQITRIEYYPTGLVKKATLPDGSFTTYTYDAAHRLTQITDAEGNYIQYTLDAAGNKVSEYTFGYDEDPEDGEANAALRKLHREYNLMGELAAQRDAANVANRATRFAYDATGNAITVTDALGRETGNTYDPLDRLAQTIQNVGGLNVTTQFAYDSQDNLTEVTDPKGLKTKYSYNGFGDLTRLESPDTGVTTYTYDSAGNRESQTDARGITATYSYDALNRLLSVSYPDPDVSQNYTWDEVVTTCPVAEQFHKGRLSKLKNGSGTTFLRYCYDRFGNVTRKIQNVNGKVFTTVYSYTASGQVKTLTYPGSGMVVDYVRDALGRTTEVGVTRAGQSRQVLLTAAGYYPFGPAQEWVFGNGRLFQRTLNQDYQPGVVQDQRSGGLSFGYEFDAVGNLSVLRDGFQAEPPKRTYTYDALNRLTETRNGTNAPNGTLLEAYTYDATGNRLSVTDNGVTSTYAMAGSNHWLYNANGKARGYDAVGNTTSIGGLERQFTYNDANRMNYVRRNGAAAQYYEYNGKGEQVRRWLSGTDNVYTVYDEAGQWLGEYDNAGAPIQQVIWLDNLPVGLVIGPDSQNKPLHFIQADALGTPRRIIDSQRDVAVWNWPLTGEAFGNDAPIEDADADGVPLVFNLRFPGQRFDAASGLNYNYFRDYDAASGRYMESDSIGLAGGINTYSYVEADPLGYIDAPGLAKRRGGGSPGAGGNSRDRRGWLREYLGDKEREDELNQHLEPVKEDYRGAVDKLSWEDWYVCTRVVCYEKRTPIACSIGDGWNERRFLGTVMLSDVAAMPGCKCERTRHVSTFEVDQLDTDDILEALARARAARNSMTRTGK